MIAHKNFEYQEMLDFMMKTGDFFQKQVSINHLSIPQYAKKMCEKGTIAYEIRDNIVVGMVIGYTDNTINNLSYITQVFVLPEYRRSGIAGKLLDEYIAYCIEKHLDGIWLTTENYNDKAIKLYEGKGFKKVFYEHEYLVKLLLKI